MAKDKGKQKKKKSPLIAVTVGKHHDEKKKGGKKGSISQLGREERQMMLTVTGPQEPLDYPTHLLALSDGTFTKEYEIPEEDREKVFRKLYLFDSPPSMDTDMMDIHEGKKFKVKDFRVIREDGGNFIVSPFYPASGGTLLDWVQCSAVQKDESVVVVANVFRKEPPKDTKEEPSKDTN
ncbi:MAG: hypothetical protein IKS92_08620 [Victivallales bacterium]|nr:hypothetical protein [Victivallales bacterium]MBR4371096.1 hypothetical protein [Victivallales bacterium]MBR5080385.1 hypothetical protein [Victivallales bacterium]